MMTRWISPTLAAALILASVSALLAGPMHIPLSALFDGSDLSAIIWQLRAPRIVLAILIGAGLGASGAVMQGYLRNPLADPGLFGISGAAALGAVCSLYFGFAVQYWMLPVFALIGATGGMAVLVLLAGRSGSVLVFTLAGVMLASLTGALTALLISLSPSPFAMSEIVTWMLGAVTDRSWEDVAFALPPIAIGIGLLYSTRRALAALTLGEATARSLGFDLSRLQWIVVMGTGLAVGGGVAVAGIIGFVGLVVPHLLRALIGGRPAALVLPSAIGGALLLFALRANTISEGERFALASREGALVFNNVMLSAILAIVLLGTLYPLLTEAFDVRVSVGPPYFNPVGAIFAIPMFAVMAGGPLLRWREDRIDRIGKEVALTAALVVAALVLTSLLTEIGLLPLLGLAFGIGLAVASWLPFLAFCCSHCSP